MCEFAKTPPMPDDAFALLGLPRGFDINAAALHAAFLRKSAALHPDRLSDPLAQAEAQRDSAALNDARLMLADDERRANLLLELLGGPAREHDKSLPDGFLARMLAVREDMDETLAGGVEADHERLRLWAADQRQAHIDAVRRGFAANGGRPDAAGLAAIRQELNAWRYIERMIEQLRDAGS